MDVPAERPIAPLIISSVTVPVAAIEATAVLPAIFPRTALSAI